MSAARDAGGIGPLPSAWRAVRVSAPMAFRAAPLLGVVSFVLVPYGWVSGTLFSYGLARLVDAAVDGPTVVAAAALLVGLVISRWVLDALTPRVVRTFEERIGIVLERECLIACADTPGVEHFERPEYLDRFEQVRDEGWIIHWMFEALVEFSGSLVRAAVVVVFLVSIDERLVIAPAAALATIAVSVWHRRRAIRVEERARSHKRLARHLFRLALEPDAALELRVHGAGEWLREQRRAAWRARYRIHSSLRFEHAIANMAASTLAIGAQAVSIIIVVSLARDGAATPGQVLLVIALLVGLQQTVSLVAETGGWLVGCLETSRRFVWLMDRRDADGRSNHEGATAPAVPARLARGIRLEAVSFAYPGTRRVVLKCVDLTLPAGAVVAVVGANGSGKTTLVKLLLRLYEPTAGEITVDGVPIDAYSVDEWRRRTTAVPQDFHRTDLPLQEAVGIGDLESIDDPERVVAALTAAGAAGLLDLPSGLATPLGPKWTGGVGLSGGQWQQVATARAAMRAKPILTVLDEPTANLDAATEHALFTRYADSARRGRQTGVVLLVTHRFSTVRLADRIVVLEDGAVTEAGTHHELLAGGGLYATLYRLQAEQYR